MSECISILNIGAGKINPLDLNFNINSFIVNLDPMYYNAMDPSFIENEHNEWLQSAEFNLKYQTNVKAVEWMERYSIHFDVITLYRYLEHVPKHELLYFIYLLSTSLEVNGIVDVIVPNYKILAKRILEEDVNHINFDKDDILTTTELLNEPSCPHASIWTPERAHHYFNYEGRFEIIEMNDEYEFDGRNIYMRFKAKRIK